MPRFTKISATGEQLPADATDFEAVLDTVTGLQWSARNVSDDELNFADAEKAVAELTLAGANDWRLPTITELFGIVDHTKYSPAIDTEAFPDTKSDWYWTATPYAASSSVYAWIVGFHLGGVDNYLRDNGAFVRAVRAASPAGQ